LKPRTVSAGLGKRLIQLRSSSQPLSFHRSMRGALWLRQLRGVLREKPELFTWAAKQLKYLANQHGKGTGPFRSVDLLRAAGALEIVGMKVGDRITANGRWRLASFRFHRMPHYECPVELVDRSAQYRRNRHDVARYPRLVILCLKHNGSSLPEYVDVVELGDLAQAMQTLMMTQ
jgi:hypothetical protein